MWLYGLISRKVKALGNWLADQSWSDAAVDQAFVKVDAIASWLDRITRYRPDRDDSPLSMSLDGSGEAIGRDTIATADLNANVTDHGSVSIGTGRASFFAAAEGERPYATTDAYSNVDGADFVLTFDRTVTGQNWESTQHSVIALDFAAFELRNPYAFTFERDLTSDTVFDVSEGNVATADFEAEVEAEDSVLDIYADALAIEDAFSGSSIEATLAIG